MRIVRRNADSVVVYTFPNSSELFITGRGLIEKNGMHDFSIKPDTHEILKVENPEGIITPGAFTYIDGVWAVPDETLLSEDVIVSRVQFLIAIQEAGKTPELETAVSGIGVKRKIRYDNCVTFKLDTPLVNGILAKMPDTTDEDMALIFKRASQIFDR
jgi:hypothetical protein